MIPLTVGGDVTYADAPVTRNAVMPTAAAATMTGGFLKRFGFLEPLSLSTAACLPWDVWALESE